jgi:hypothetical protein
VAIRALPWRHGVLSREREAGLRVVEVRRRPSACRVTCLACLRKVLLDVIGVRRAGVVGQVARYASRDRNVVIVVLVAIGALPRRHGVQAGERECGLRVVEVCRRPAAGSVAGLAGLREAQLDVIGIGRAGVVGQVARYASRDRNVVVVVLVAIGTLPRRHGMHSGKRKTGCRVIELGIQPVIETVAVVTSEREVASRVVGVSRILEISLVAAIAVRRHRAVLTERSAFVASVTIDGGVCSHQWEPIVVLLNLLDLYHPSLDRMTLFAIGAEQALVDVGVAGRALR